MGQSGLSALALEVVTAVSCESFGCSEASFSSTQLALERVEVWSTGVNRFWAREGICAPTCESK